MARWFLRCPDCLSVAAVDAAGPPHGTVCNVCSVRFELMGRVSVDRLVKTELRCPCDDRCTCASGPKCSCHCGGKNHGSGLVIEVQIDAGGVPRVTPPDARAAQRRDEWRAALERATEAAPGREQAGRKADGEYLSPAGFEMYLQHGRWMQEIRRIRHLRTHTGRMKAISKLAGPPPAVVYQAPAWLAPVEVKPLVRRAVPVGQQIGLLG